MVTELVVLQKANMAILDDLRVEIVDSASGEALPEYPRNVPPESMPKNDDTLVENYVEAQAGRDFQVHVYVLKSFELYKASGVFLHIDIDDETFNYSCYRSRYEIFDGQQAEAPITFSSAPQQDGKDWFDVTPCFYSLRIGKILNYMGS